MGEIIRKGAAASDVFSDVRETHTKALAKGGKLKDMAEQRLANFVTLISLLEARFNTATETLAPLEAALQAIDYKADQFIGNLSDSIWNTMGRPNTDPNFSVLFPGGISFYTEGPNEEQPERMELLAELLDTNPIPRIAAAESKAMANQVREIIAEYRAAVDATAGPRARVRLLERIRMAIARSAQIELGHLKRLYKTEGFSEAEIHTVIPDHPRGPKPSSSLPTAPPGKPGNP